MSQSIAPETITFSVGGTVRAWRYPFNPARFIARCQSAAHASSASFAFCCPVSTVDIAVRNDSSKVGHTGSRGSSVAVFIDSASTGAQPYFSCTSGWFSTDTRGGALPRTTERRIHSLLHAIWMNSNAHSLFLFPVGTPNVQPPTLTMLSAIECAPGARAQPHFPAVFDSFGSLISVPYGASVMVIA